MQKLRQPRQKRKESPLRKSKTKDYSKKQQMKPKEPKPKKENTELKKPRNKWKKERDNTEITLMNSN